LCANNSCFANNKGIITGEAVNKLSSQLQRELSQVMSKSNADIAQPSCIDLVNTVTDNQLLWNKYCVALRINNIVTNASCK